MWILLSATGTVAAESIEQEVKLHHAKQYVADFFRKCVSQQDHVIGLNQDASGRTLQCLLEVDFHRDCVAAWKLADQYDL